MPPKNGLTKATKSYRNYSQEQRSPHARASLFNLRSSSYCEEETLVYYALLRLFCLFFGSLYGSFLRGKVNPVISNSITRRLRGAKHTAKGCMGATQGGAWLDSHSKFVDASEPQVADVRHYPSGKFSDQTDDKIIASPSSAEMACVASGVSGVRP